MPKKLLASLVLPALFVSALTGCSGDDSTKASDDPSADASAATDPVADGAAMGWPAGVAKVKGFKPVMGGIGATEIGTCGLGKGKQTVQGKVTSAATEQRDFAVVVTWMDKTGKMVGSGSQVVPGVQPEATFNFKVTGTVTKKAQNCSPGIYAGTAK